MTLEMQMERLLKNGRVVVRGIKGLRRLMEYAAREGYEVEHRGFIDGPFLIAHLVVHE
jgi:hypothetical protein